MSKRATRGAGYHWGHAEEAGKAARWLSERDLPGPELLAQLLVLNDGRTYTSAAPKSLEGAWQAGEGDLCPLLVGSALCDCAKELCSGHTFEFEATAYPLLLAPYVAAASKLNRHSATLSWDQLVLHITPDHMLIDGNQDQMMAGRASRVTCQGGPMMGPTSSKVMCGCGVNDDDWMTLGTLAMRTFAPATEASRISGAGAGLTDNE